MYFDALSVHCKSLRSCGDGSSFVSAFREFVHRKHQQALAAHLNEQNLTLTGSPNVSPTKSSLQEEKDEAAAMMLQFRPPTIYNCLSSYHGRKRQVYIDHATRLDNTAGNHAFYTLMSWCEERSVFLHPGLQIERSPSQYRDYKIIARERLPRHMPLIAVPESLCIGFRDLASSSSSPPLNSLHDTEMDKAFAAASGTSDSDVCQFFFDSLGMIVTDLIAALGGKLTDVRHPFAESIRRIRTLLNAPYFDDDVAFGKDDTCLADVFLQMIRNYILGGPLVSKVDRDELRWAVSVCLSHSTPLCIGSCKSIGIVPVVHLMPHGGVDSNCVVIARSSRRQAARKMAAYFHHHFGMDFASWDARYATETTDDGPQLIYVVPLRDIEVGEELLTQAMAPVCDRETEAAHMWKLSCGQCPLSSMPTSQLAVLQAETVKEIVNRGGDIIHGRDVSS